MENLKATALRIENETLQYVDKLSGMMNLDRSTTIRILLKEGIDVDRKNRALEFYQKKIFTLEQATKFANMYIGEFLELLMTSGIELNVNLEDYKESLNTLKKVWK